MKTILLCLVLTWATSVQAQNRMILFGEPTDSTLLKKKQRLEAGGFTVTIKPKSAGDNPLLTMGDTAFRQRHLSKPLPPFTLTDQAGNVIRSSDLAGKYVHINFWSTTCAPCIQEFSELNELKRKYGDKEWIFLAFAPESRDQVSRVLIKRPLHYTVIPDAKAYYNQLGINGYPKNFFLDKSGIIRQVTDGTHLVRDPQTNERIPDNHRFYDQIMTALSQPQR